MINTRLYQEKTKEKTKRKKSPLINFFQFLFNLVLLFYCFYISCILLNFLLIFKYDCKSLRLQCCLIFSFFFKILVFEIMHRSRFVLDSNICIGLDSRLCIVLDSFSIQDYAAHIIIKLSFNHSYLT